jgi:hypothetical protein
MTDTTAEPTAAALAAHHQRVTAMLADPDCVGELLLVGLAMARSIDLADPPSTDGGGMPMKTIAEQVYGRRWLPTSLLGVGILSDHADANPYRRIRDLFRADRRRYRPDDTDRYHSVLCSRPMVRRDGLCGRDASHRKVVTDPANGERRWLGACSNKACRVWLAGVLARNCADLADRAVPVPAANTGGVLERHLPEIDWWAVWRAVDPKWSPPPEGRRFERPTLTLLLGEVVPGRDVNDREPAPTGPRPTLVALEGGWR